MGSEKTVVIVQSSYIPWKGYFDLIAAADEFILYDEVQFTKRDWRNRNQIKTPRGLQWLTIPVHTKGLFLQRIDECKVSDPEWAEQHWKSIEHNYRRGAGFETFGTPLNDLYQRAAGLTLLSEINVLFLRHICQWLGLQTPIRRSTEYAHGEGKTKRLVDICRSAGATRYLSGPKAKEYLDESMWKEAGIELAYMDYDGYPSYRQLYPPFVHTVSIVDLLLNEGREARRFLKGRTS